MIEIKDGHYARDGFALRMSLAIDKGARVSVIGPSGAGKSTLLNVLAGFEPLQSGTVNLDGQNVTDWPPAARPVSFIFQDNNCFAHLTARHNVAIGLIPSLKLNPAQWQNVDQALQRVGLAALAARKPGDMSGGERQRIALARVLVRQKPILLLDEPFAALGPALRQEMMQLLISVQAERNLTILMVTHQPEDAKALGGSVIFVDQGVAQPPVAAKHFFNQPAPDVARYLGA
jgi:thiamine transport system ATP-binding protein